jgi:hypothetical protein
MRTRMPRINAETGSVSKSNALSGEAYKRFAVGQRWRVAFAINQGAQSLSWRRKT